MPLYRWIFLFASLTVNAGLEYLLIKTEFYPANCAAISNIPNQLASHHEAFKNSERISSIAISVAKEEQVCTQEVNAELLTLYTDDPKLRALVRLQNIKIREFHNQLANTKEDNLVSVLLAAIDAGEIGINESIGIAPPLLTVLMRKNQSLHLNLIAFSRVALLFMTTLIYHTTFYLGTLQRL